MKAYEYKIKHMTKTEKNIAHLFGRNLRRIRLAYNYSQEHLAELLDTTSVTISNYERGFSWPGRDSLARIVDIFNVPVAVLFMDVSPEIMFCYQNVKNEIKNILDDTLMSKDFDADRKSRVKRKTQDRQ